MARDDKGASIRSQRHTSEELELVSPATLTSLRKYAHKLGRNDAEADDLLQATLLKAVDGLQQGKYQPMEDGSLRRWAVSIMHNTFISEKRKRKHETPACDIDDFDLVAERILTVPPDQERGALLVKSLPKALEMILKEQKEAVLLMSTGVHFWEAAAQLGVPLGTVRSRVWRGRQALRQILEQETPMARVLGYGD